MNRLSNPPLRRRLLLVIAIVATVAVAATIAQYLGARLLKAKVAAALGPRAEVGAISVGLTRIEIDSIRIAPADGWPAAEELSARRVIVTPDWNALLSRNVRIASLRIEDGYLSLLRRADGKLVLLPSLLGPQTADDKDKKGKAAAPASAGPEVSIGSVELSGASVDFYDASVRQPAHRLRLENVSVGLGQILIPSLRGRTSIHLDGTAKGVQRDGRVTIDGWMEFASRDSELRAQLAGVDLVAFQPYLIKAAETGVRRGTLDLELQSTVERNRLRAPGHITLSGLELAPSRTFMGMPREAVAHLLQDRNGRISADFTLAGDISDPKFSLNENFLAQVGIGAAGALGISIEGLITGIGNVGGSAAEGIGNALGKLLGTKKPAHQ